VCTVRLWSLDFHSSFCSHASPLTESTKVVDVPSSHPSDISNARTPQLLERIRMFSALFLIEWDRSPISFTKGYGVGQLFQFAVIYCSRLLAFG